MKWSRIAVMAIVTLPAAAGARGQDHLAFLREQFQAEHDVVHQAKSFPKLGDALLDQMRKDADAGNIADAQAVFTEYRNDLQRTVAALKAREHNAEKHPGGFKELEIYLRKTLRGVEQIILLVPFEQRAPFEAQRREVSAIDEELFHLLFPRQPAASPGNKPPK